MDIISKGASAEQFQYEVKALSKEDRQALLEKVNIAKSTATVSPEDVLALKADLSIPWNKLRFLRRYAHNKSYLIHIYLVDYK